MLLFTIAAFEALLLRFENFPVLSTAFSHTFILLVIYNLMYAIYTRYDQEITRSHYLICVLHILFFVTAILIMNNRNDFELQRTIFSIINIAIPYILAIKKCHQQFKTYRFGDKVLYGALLIIVILFIGYLSIYMLFFIHQTANPLMLYFISLISFVCILFLGFTLSIIYSLVGKLRKEIFTDRLTGAKNRNYLKDISNQLISAAKRNKTPLSIILCDIDWFKKINDTYGHSSGDKVLIEFTDLIESSLRTEDVFIRIGGEEFLILLPHIDKKQAHQTAERLREIVNNHKIHVDIDHINISACFGITEVDLNLTIEQSINNADIALYEAKRNGRNKVITFTR